MSLLRKSSIITHGAKENHAWKKASILIEPAEGLRKGDKQPSINNYETTKKQDGHFTDKNHEISKISYWKTAGKFFKSIPRLFDIRIFINMVKENLAIYREAKSVNEQDVVRDPKLVKAKVFLKFSAALAISEIAGTYIIALPAGIALQEINKNAYMGVAGTFLGDYLGASAAFQLAWFSLNIEYYSRSANNVFRKIKNFYKDILSFEFAAFKSAFPVYMICSGISSAMIALTNLASPGLAERAHVMPVIAQLLNSQVAEVVYLVNLSRRLPDLVQTLTKRYEKYLERVYNQDQE